MADDDRKKYPSEEAERFQVRMPPGLRDRIKVKADKNNRSMNAEIIATLRKAYPPPSINIEDLSRFLNSLIMPFADDPEMASYDKYIKYINNRLASIGAAWTVKADPFGQISFFPYASPQSESDNANIEQKPVRMTEAEAEELWKWMQEREEADKKQD